MTNCLNPKSPVCLDPKSVIEPGGYHLMTARIFGVLGIVCALLGIISDAANASLGLESASWLLLAIAFCVAGIPPCIGWAMAVYLKSIEGKKEQ